LKPRQDTSANYNLDVFCGTWNNNNSAGTAIATFQSTGNVGIGTTSPSWQTTVYGTGQNTALLTDAGSKSASLFVGSSNGTAGAGGAVLLGGITVNGVTSQWAIKSIMTSTTANGTADLAFSTRAGTGDTSLTERMRIDSSGNVLINTSSQPSTTGGNAPKLTVVGSRRTVFAHGENALFLLPAANNGAANGDAGLYMWISEPGQTWTGAGIARNMYNTTSWPRVNSNLSGQMMRFDEGTGILFTVETSAGTRNSPLTLSATQAQFNATGTSGTMQTIFMPSLASGSLTDIYLGKATASYQCVALGFSYNTSSTSTYAYLTLYGDSATTGITLTSGGKVGIGKQQSTYSLEISADSAAKPGAGGLWTVVSDERIKTNIIPADLDRCYEIVKSVPLKHYGFAPGVYGDNQIQDKHNLGWIAQDVQKVFKNAVSTKPFTLHNNEVIQDCLDLNSGQLIAALYGAVQSLMQKVEELQRKI